MENIYDGLGHIAIYTKDMTESITFYEKIGATIYKTDSVITPEGEKKLALLHFAGFIIELIQPQGSFEMGEGSIPHFAVYVKDLDTAADAIRTAGVDTFLETEKKVLPETFGGLQNWFFTGPSGEQIELLQML